ncbi:MAG: TIGR03118 family protein, partial [Pirellulales bacterium]
GDGSSSAGTVTASGATFSVAGTHTYTTSGAHTITTSIKDDGGSTATATSSTSGAGFLRLNLVSDQPGDGLVIDPNLVNPWGIGLAPTTGDFWIADNGADVATLYGGDVAGSTFSKAGLVVSIPGGAPTGQVFNGTSDFIIHSETASAPALFIFASENGSITGWNPAVPPPPPSTHAQTGATVPGAVYKGLALGNNGSVNELFATNFAAGTIDVFDGSFHRVTLAAGAFTDPNLPAGYAPFGIANLGGKLYVSYALQDPAKHDDVAGFGHGFVDVYDASGVLLDRLVTGTPGDPNSPLNSPWGMAIAPAGFGGFGGDLLVGNFGDGKINAFDPNTGTFLGTLSDPSGQPLVIDGLWALQFGNGATAGDPSTLFFSAGTDGEQHGTFGALINAQNTPLDGEGTAIAPTEGASFSGAIATFAASNISAHAGDFSATIDWGDGATAAGTVVANPEGGFNVVGAHTFAEEGTDSVHVTVTDNAGHTITIGAGAKVADATLTASGTTFTATVDNTTSVLLTVATFMD